MSPNTKLAPRTDNLHDQYQTGRTLS